MARNIVLTNGDPLKNDQSDFNLLVKLRPLFSEMAPEHNEKYCVFSMVTLKHNSNPCDATAMILGIKSLLATSCSHDGRCSVFASSGPQGTLMSIIQHS
jgi:hypothetical protein